MANLTIYDLMNPDYALHRQQLQLKAEIEGAKIGLQERHHYEMMEAQQERNSIEIQKMEVQKEEGHKNREAMLEREKIHSSAMVSVAGIQGTYDLIKADIQQTNNLEALTIKSIFDRKLSKQNHEQDMEKMTLASHLKRQEQEQLFLQDKKLAKLKQKQNIEQSIINANLDRLKMHLEHVLTEHRITYESMNDITKQLIERALKLGDYASDKDISEWIKEKWKEQARDIYRKANE